jgi:hypothetical protein
MAYLQNARIGEWFGTPRVSAIQRIVGQGSHYQDPDRPVSSRLQHGDSCLSSINVYCYKYSRHASCLAIALYTLFVSESQS